MSCLSIALADAREGLKDIPKSTATTRVFGSTVVAIEGSLSGRAEGGTGIDVGLES